MRHRKLSLIAIDGKKYLPVELGEGTKGYILGAHNIGNKLKVVPFEENDVLAAKEYFGGLETKFYKKILTLRLKM